MRIIGGHDYFDSALAYGRDETLVFTRRKFEDAPVVPHREAGISGLEKTSFGFVDSVSKPWRRAESVEHKGTRYDFLPQTVWFAGKRYGGVKVSSYSSAFLSGRNDRQDWFWSQDKFADFLDSIDARLGKPRNWGESRSINSGNVTEHFEGEGSRAEVDWLAASRVSIAVWHHDAGWSPGTRGWHEKNGWKFDIDGLGNMGFAKRLDPFAAFQELSMWVGGVLPRDGNPMVEIRGEKVMLQKHGMDEWSFKTPPGGRM